MFEEDFFEKIERQAEEDFIYDSIMETNYSGAFSENDENNSFDDDDSFDDDLFDDD